ncbi:MAG: hypothetical protein AAFY59_04105 [Pseudomonadota bacterium]
MSETPRDHEPSDADWDTLRAAAPQPGPDLLARIAADAARLQPRQRRGWRDRLGAGLGAFADALGGWQGASALTASALLGLWLGMGQSAAVAEMSAQLLGAEAELVPDDPLTAFLVEG